MIALGVLWFDDDPRHPVARKIIAALERYRERVGYEPTVCQLNPAQAAALAAPAPKRRTRHAAPGKLDSVQLPTTLRLQPDAHISPNYFLVGIATGETPRIARGRRIRGDDVDPEGRGRRRHPAASAPAPAPARARRTTAGRAQPATGLPPARHASPPAPPVTATSAATGARRTRGAIARSA